MSKPINAPYRSLRGVLCDCNQPAVAQAPVLVGVGGDGGGFYVQWIALCPKHMVEYKASERTPPAICELIGACEDAPGVII